MSPSTFIQNENSRISIRTSYIVLVADLGRIHGDQCHLIGVCRDWDAETGIISFGIATAGDVAKVEMQLGKRLTDLFESGAAIEGWISDAPSRVVDLKPLEIVRTAAVSAATAPSSMLQKLTTNQTRHADFAQACAEHGVQMIRIEKQRDAALSLRRSWSIEKMKHRGDWPAWLPSWIREVIRQDSRIWLELGNQPAPATPEIPPVIQSVIVEPTPAAPVTKGFVATLKGAFQL